MLYNLAPIDYNLSLNHHSGVLLVNKTKNKTLMAASLAFASLAQAEPVHLTCDTVSPNGQTESLILTLNEDAGSVTFTDSGRNRGRSIKVPAQFTQTEVLFKQVVLPSIPVPPMTYQLDRTTGQVAYFINPELKSTGTCNKSAPVERKF